MEMPMRFIRKLPIPKVLKEEYPIDSNIEKIKEKVHIYNDKKMTLARISVF